MAVCSSREAAEVLASRGGWAVEEMELDLVFRDSWMHLIGFDGREVLSKGPIPVLELPESGPDPWNTGGIGYGWTAEEAEYKARKIYQEKIDGPYKKLIAEAEARWKLSEIS